MDIKECIMSVVVKCSALTKDHINIINDLLFLQPKEKYNFGGKKKCKAVKPIEFRQIITSPVDGENYIFLPYRFAAQLFGKNIAAERIYTPSVFKFTGTLRDYQAEDIGEFVKHLEEYSTTTLCCSPGYGKTIISAYLAAKYSLLTLVIFTATTLLKQWKNTFEKFTTAKVWIVGEEAMPPLFNVIICLDKRVEKIPVDIRNRIGMFIIDEAHIMCTPSQVDRLLGFHPRYIIAATATLKRDDGMHEMIYAMCGNHCVVRDIKKDFHVYKIETGIKGVRKDRTDGKRGIQWHPLAKSLAFSNERNQMIVAMALKNPSYKILILTGYRAHTTLLHRTFVELGESVDYLCGPKKNYHDSRILIGTISKIGTGFDEASFCDDYNGVKINLGILTHSIAKTQLLEQTVGRVFRADFPNIMHLVDDDKTIANHWKTAKRWYKSKGGILHE